MTVNDVLKLIAQTVSDLLSPETWRILLLLLLAWAVILLAQIRRLLRRLVEEDSTRASLPQQDAPPSLDDLISRRREP
jgi:hypothetical protein